jgi:hypothetical protein
VSPCGVEGPLLPNLRPRQSRTGRVEVEAGGPLERGSITRFCLCNIDRNNWGCATSRAFREVARRTADTVRLRHDPCESRLSFEATEPTVYASTFSSHFFRTLITDSRHNRCENISTVHHRELRPSPETNAFPASDERVSGLKFFTCSLTTNGSGQHPASARQTAKVNAKSHIFNTLPLTILLSST